MISPNRNALNSPTYRSLFSAYRNALSKYASGVIPSCVAPTVSSGIMIASATSRGIIR